MFQSEAWRENPDEGSASMAVELTCDGSEHTGILTAAAEQC